MRTIGVVVVVVRPGNMRTSYLIVTLFTLGVVSAFMLVSRGTIVRWDVTVCVCAVIAQWDFYLLS